MKNQRFLCLVLVLLVFMIGISAASAADASASDIISTDDNEVLILDETIDETVSSSNNYYDEELILENGNANDLVENSNDNTPLKDGATGSFSDLNKLINEDCPNNATITLNSNYKYTDGGDAFVQGISIDHGVTIDGNGYTIDGSKSARIFHIIGSGGVTFKNINFIGGHSWCGGAIYVEERNGNNKVINCNFTNNTARDGGAIYVDGCNLNVINSTFTNNQALVNSGALQRGNAINCTFIENKAGDSGGAMLDVTAINCIYTNNDALYGGAMYWGNAILCLFEGDSDTTCNTNIIPATLSVSDFTTLYNSGDKLIFNLTADNTNYDGFKVTIHIYYQSEDLVETYYGLSGEDEGWVVNLNPGTYQAVLSLESHPDVEKASATITVKEPPKETQLTAANVTTSYNVNKDLVIILEDIEGNALCGMKVTVDLGTAKEYTTDENGQIKIAVGRLVPKAYTVKISFAGDENYVASEVTATVTVKKATPTMAASAKSFKFEDKTKKYTVTLKDSEGAVKNRKVTLKVNGQTYTATTDSKGVATFKLTKLSKKGTYNAVITYAGDKYYNKVTKNAKITVKAPAWKTVAKGSKDKAMVKKVQQALKKNGYYLSYKGRYLKVDGLFHKYTEMAVKQFQKDKGLKVTGKVDYATAKKLKLI